MGWISGYRPPSAPDQFFVWQVAVHPEARGTGLGAKMLNVLLSRPAARGARLVTTTITKDNQASWGLFQSFAKTLGAPLSKAPHFQRDDHFAGAHETEWLVSIGPLS